MSPTRMTLGMVVAGLFAGATSLGSTVALYHLDETGGTTVADIVGGNTLTQQANEATEGQPAQTGFGTSVGGWLTWNGAYRTTTFPNLSGSWTIEFFYNSFGNPIFDPNPVEFGNSDTDRFRIAPNQGHAFEYRTSGFVLSTGYVDYDSDWHHVALTYNATTGTLTLFYDGALKASVAGTVASTTFLSVGCANTSQWVYAGLVDEVRVSDTVVYAADFTPPAVPFGAVDIGACCYPDGTCADTAAADCTGIWFGAGSACYQGGCPPIGACCVGDGTCFLSNEPDCTGTWRGAGTNCDDTVCLGACCASDYSCTMTSVLDCAGTWGGAGKPCDPSPCADVLTVALYHLDEPYGSPVVRDVTGAAPLGAISDGNTEAKPAQDGFGFSVGVWSTYDEAYQTSAFPNVIGDWTIEFFVNALDDAGTPFGDPCPVNFGLNSTYRFRFAPNNGHAFEYRTPDTVLSSSYIEYDALWHHAALTYGADDTELSLFWDGRLKARTTAVVPRTDFLAIGSAYTGNDVFAGLVDELRVSHTVLYTSDFTPPTKPFVLPESGACCLGDGWCMVATPAACAGTWLGAGTSCDPGPCITETGACCQADDTCTLTTAWDCTGTWHGPGTACEVGLCRYRPFVGMLGDLPGGDFLSEARGISEDGHVVVGASSSTAGYKEAFRWTPQEGMTGLGALPADVVSSAAATASRDGSVIVGASASYNASSGGTEAFLWSAATGMIGMGDLPGGGFDSSAQGVSGDGVVIAGEANGLYFGGPVAGSQAYRWTSAEGMVSLGNLSGDPYFSFARAVSDDGRTIVGESDESDQCTHMAFRWTNADGMVRLGDLPGGNCRSTARGVSADGSVITGSSTTSSGSEAFLWTATSGMVSLGDLPGSLDYSEGWDVSADGSVAVGLGYTPNGERAFIWDARYGMRELSSVLLGDYNVNPVNLRSRILKEARAISGDGRTIVGIGYNTLGKMEAWLVRTPLALGDLNANGVVDVGDFTLLCACIAGPGVTQPPPQSDPAVFERADIDGDGDVDLDDVAAFQRAFGGA